jgi:hypothetical protein
MLWDAVESHSGFLRRRLGGGVLGDALPSCSACLVARMWASWACFGVTSRILIRRASHWGVHSLKRLVGRCLGMARVPLGLRGAQ